MKITRRSVLGQIGLLLAAGEILPCCAGGFTRAESFQEHIGQTPPLRDALIWDDHSGFDAVPDYDLELLEDWRQAGVTYLSINVGYDVVSWERAIRSLGAYITWLEKRPDKFLLVKRADDVLEAKKTRRMAISFDLEGMNALNGEVSLVAAYYQLGVRQMLTAYNKNNVAGGGVHDKDTGLTAFGAQVITEMNRVGMLVDCSHTGYRTTMDIMGAATQPVVFSHANPKALRKHSRNITDDQIRACAKTGGVVGVTGLGYFLPERPSSLIALADCVTYVRDLVGIDHIGLGLDHTPPGSKGGGDAWIAAHPDYWPPAEYDPPWPMEGTSPVVFKQLASLLTQRGWANGDVLKVLGGNFFRVAREVWK